MVRQGGLGRGLASLIPQTKKKTDSGQNYFGAQSYDNDIDIAKKDAGRQAGSNKKIEDISLRSIIEIPTDSIVSNPYQPRLRFNQEKLQELADSIGNHGVIQPIVVTRKNDGKYELIAGERRLEASKIAGLLKIPAVIKNVSDQEKLELSLIENIQRHDLDAIEQAKSYKRLAEEFSLKQDEIAKRVGKSRSAVANTLRLLGLPIEIQKALQELLISEGHARTILSLSNPEKQRALFKLILKNNLNVREAERKVTEISGSVPKKKNQEIDPEAKQKENELSKSIGTKVKLQKTSAGGKIIIEYYSQDELNNLYNKLISLEK